MVPFLEDLDTTAKDSLIKKGNQYKEGPDTENRLIRTETPDFEVIIVAANLPPSNASDMVEVLGLDNPKPGTVYDQTQQAQPISSEVLLAQAASNADKSRDL